VADDKDKMAVYLNECRRMGIHVLPPDVNESAANFTPVGADIRFGLTAVRNVGHNVVDGIVAAREAHGKAVNFHGFLDQVPLVVCNKRVIESLIKAGAFESMGHSRRALMTVYEGAVDGVLDLKRNEANGRMICSASSPTPIGADRQRFDLPDWDKQTKRHSA
jgi:DNA polymerase-3 subunit alpha